MLEWPHQEPMDLNQVISEVKKQLRNRHPQWTDHSPHDPGITILELLAYLKVNQHREIRTMGAANKMKFLELLDIQPRPARCATTDVIFSTRHRKAYLPSGTKLAANRIIFETLEGVTLYPNRLTGIWLEKVEEEKERFSLELQAETNLQRGWHPFGSEPQPGNRFYLGFQEAFPSEVDLRLKFQLGQEYPVKRNPVNQEDEFYPLVDLLWEYYGENRGKIGWHPLTVKEDTTHQLLFPGFITYCMEGEPLPVPHLNPDQRIDEQADGQVEDQAKGSFALRCTLLGGEYDVSPRIKNIFFHCHPVRQQESLSRSYTFNYRQFKEDRLYLDSHLAYFGQIRAFAAHQGYWVELKEIKDFYLEKEPETGTCRFRMWRIIPSGDFAPAGEKEDGPVEPDENQPVLKVVAVEQSFLEKAVFGSSTGFINQSFDLEMQPLLASEFSMMVGETLPDRRTGWIDWELMPNRHKAGRNDKCYQLDPTRGRISFGDNRNGEVPPRGKNNLLITDLAITRGEQGNIQSGNIHGFKEQDEVYQGLDVYQLFPSQGGREGEDLAQAEGRLLRELKVSQRAVRNDDFSRLARQTPGLIIEHVKTLPLFKPGMEGYPEQKADNCVTLVVEPYRASGQGKLTEAYRKNILRHLENHRLVTTVIHVVEPNYVGLEIYGEIVVKTGYGRVEKTVKETIAHYIDTFQRQQQWKVHLNQGDLYGAIDLLDCVSYLRYLGIEPFGYRVQKSSKGDIVIPADSKFYLKSCDLTLLDGEQ